MEDKENEVPGRKRDPKRQLALVLQVSQRNGISRPLAASPDLDVMRLVQLVVLEHGLLPILVGIGTPVPPIRPPLRIVYLRHVIGNAAGVIIILLDAFQGLQVYHAAPAFVERSLPEQPRELQRACRLRQHGGTVERNVVVVRNSRLLVLLS